ncbi:hypothetical protein PVAP13_9NG580800 [Panicum virgatum]|uniref:Uncharacterized protein n=1 Tax=Panicum virgatum TaxID=38727 RepID=A0A8T0MUI6_PANVG|nr:hypothetical protein PVAP13_9NG580800 [Panicum virgatum]
MEAGPGEPAMPRRRKYATQLAVQSMDGWIALHDWRRDGGPPCRPPAPRWMIKLPLSSLNYGRDRSAVPGPPVLAIDHGFGGRKTTHQLSENGGLTQTNRPNCTSIFKRKK